VEKLETQLHYLFGTNWVFGEWFLLHEGFTERVRSVAEKIIAEQDNLLPAIAECERSSKIPSNGNTLKPDSFQTDIYNEILKVDETMKILDGNRKLIEHQIKTEMVGFSGISGVVSLVKKTGKPTLDTKAIQENHPNEHQACTSTIESLSDSFLWKGVPALSKIDPQLHEQIKALTPIQFHATHISTPEKKRETEVELLHKSFIELSCKIETISWEKEQLGTKLQATIGENEGIQNICSWKREKKLSQKFSTTEFKDKYPHLISDYLKPAQESVSVMISPKRPYRF
jgi:hypothetical protein